MNYSRRHFHSFDALRFFAFLKVFLLHLPIVAFPAFNFIRNGGGIGVIFFFVLSGFLITYILLTEKEATGSIDLRRFFLRRILRIWPLYYLMVAFAFITPYILSFLNIGFSNDGYDPNWLMSVCFLENYQMILTRDHPNVSPLGVTWSLCIEEHFYIIWGILLYFIKMKRLPAVFIFCIVLASISRYLFIRNDLPTIDILTNIDYFVFGAIPAYLLVQRKNNFEEKILSLPVTGKMLAIVSIILYVVLSSNISYPLQPYLEPLLFGLSFGFIICIIIPEKNPIKISDWNVLTRLGVYTYGMYLYHTIIINFLAQLFKKYELSLDAPFITILFGLIAFGGTVGISILSYKLFERYFLSLKKRFTKDRMIANEAITAFSGSEKTLNP